MNVNTRVEIETARQNAQEQNFIDADGHIIWPDNSQGFDAILGTQRSNQLQAGNEVSRMVRQSDIDQYHNGLYDPALDRGTYTSPPGVPFENRAIPGDADDYVEVRFEVKEPIDTNRSNVSPWFNQPGRGVQDQHESIQDLIDNGSLELKEGR